MGFQVIVVEGNLGKEVEMRYTNTGKAVSKFSLACSQKYGEKEHTEWFNVEAWGKTAENCNQYLTKGSNVLVEGRIQTDTYTGDDGQTKRFTKLVANTVRFLGKRDAANNDPGAGYPDNQVPPPLTDDLNIPF